MHVINVSYFSLHLHYYHYHYCFTFLGKLQTSARVTTYTYLNMLFLIALFDMFQSVSYSVMSDFLRPQGLQHSRLPSPPPTPGGY